MLDDADSPAADSRELTSPGEDSGDGGERSEPKVPDGDETALEQEEGPEALSGEQDSSRQPGKSPDMGERLLGLQRPRDADDNLNTRPPVDEVITFWSVTVAEVYIGPKIDSLTKALAGIDWGSDRRSATKSRGPGRATNI